MSLPPLAPRRSGWLALLIGSLALAPVLAADLRIKGIVRETGGSVGITHDANLASYYLLLRGSRLETIASPRDAALGVAGEGLLRERSTLTEVSFFRVQEIPLNAPLDTDGDSLDDVFELQNAGELNALDPADADRPAPGFAGQTWRQVYAQSHGAPTVIRDTSPARDESGVAVTRETVLRFSRPLAAGAVLTTERLYATFSGRKLLSRVELSTDRRQVTLFYLENLPASARVRVTLDPTGLQDESGRQVDGDGDGQPGGAALMEFDTASITPVGVTGVIGHVFASDPLPDGQGGFTNRPLAGVTITVDGAEQTLRTTTDADGYFQLKPSPAGRFFVHVDGRTAVGGDWPGGAYYPFVGKAWETVAGVETNLAAGTGDIFLPLVPAGALQPVSATLETSITFLPEIIAANPALAGVEIRVPPNALFDDNGLRGGRVGIAPVSPDRLPEPLPPGLDFPLVITIQTDGPRNFDRPVPVRFPNLPDRTTGQRLAPGQKSALWSFNHDTGRWELAGPMTVTADGNFVETDPGVGVRQPGWHGTRRGAPIDNRWQPEYVDEADFYSLLSDLPDRLWNLPENTRLAFNDFTLRRLANAFSQLPTQPNDRGIMSPLVDSAWIDDSNIDLANELMNRFLDGSGEPVHFPPDSKVSQAAKDNPGFNDLNTRTQQQTQTRVAEYIQSHPGVDSFTLPAQSGDDAVSFYGPNGTDNQLSVSFGQSGVHVDSGAVTVVRDSTTGNYLYVAEPTYDVTDRYDFNDNDTTFLDRMAKDVQNNGGAQGFDTTMQIQDVHSGFVGPTGGSVENKSPRRLARADEPVLFTEGPDLTLGTNLFITPAVRVDGESLQLTENFDVVRQNLTSDADGPFWVHLLNLNTGQTLFRQQVPRLAGLQFIVAPRTHCRLSAVSVRTLASGGVRLVAGDNAVLSVAPFIPLRVTAADRDADGLSDEAEEVIGTDAGRADTDRDGVRDGPEVLAGTNPLDDLPAVVGILAATELPGTAWDVAVADTRAAVALDIQGVAIVEVRGGQELTLLNQVATAGNARRLSVDGNLVAVAAGGPGLEILELGESASAQIIGRVPVGDARSVVTADGLAFVGTAQGEIVTVHLATGTELGRVNVGAAVHDLAWQGTTLLALTTGGLKSFELDGEGLSLLGEVSVPGTAEGITGSRRLAVADGVAYLTSYPGYATVDIRDPAAMTRIAAAVDRGPNSFKQILPTGSGLGVAAVGTNPRDDGTHDVELYDLRDPLDTTRFTTRLATPGIAYSIALDRGLAYVADGRAGLEVLNFLAADRGTTPPVIRLLASFSLDPAQAEGGNFAALTAEASDDVLVREVEFYLDGTRVAADGSYPFEHRFRVPKLTAEKTTFTLRARAFDTGGNATITPEITVQILPDLTPPKARPAQPIASGFGANVTQVTALFSEPILASTLNAASFTLVGAGPDRALGTPDDVPVSGEVTLQAESRTAGFNLASPLSAGRYQAKLTRAITDLAGNALATEVIWSFEAVTGVDTDGDGLTDEFELASGLNPNSADENRNGTPDAVEDFDGDGLSNGVEMLLGTNARNPRTLNNVPDAQLDRDGDFLTDFRELSLGTDRLSADTDRDVWNDEVEVTTGSNPLIPNAYLPGIFVSRNLGQALRPTGPSFRTAQGDVLRLGDGQVMQSSATANVLRQGGPNANGYTVNSALPVRVREFELEATDLAPGELPSAGAVVIEAEDYNFEGGQHLAAASVMPYLGGDYDGRAATLGVDYFNADANNSDLYRPDTAPNNVNLVPNLAGFYALDRPGWRVTHNYREGWVQFGDWQQYTRALPAGDYWIWAALSRDGDSDGSLNASLDLVTGDATQSNPALTQLGTFSGPGTGAYGNNRLVLLRDSTTAPYVLHVEAAATTTTFRFNLGTGDFDWFVLIPTNSAPQ